jgi:hypothetical protein
VTVKMTGLSGKILEQMLSRREQKNSINPKELKYMTHHSLSYSLSQFHLSDEQASSSAKYFKE